MVSNNSQHFASEVTELFRLQDQIIFKKCFDYSKGGYRYYTKKPRFEKEQNKYLNTEKQSIIANNQVWVEDECQDEELDAAQLTVRLNTIGDGATARV